MSESKTLFLCNGCGGPHFNVSADGKIICASVTEKTNFEVKHGGCGWSGFACMDSKADVDNLLYRCASKMHALVGILNSLILRSKASQDKAQSVLDHDDYFEFTRIRSKNFRLKVHELISDSMGADGTKDFLNMEIGSAVSLIKEVFSEIKLSGDKNEH